MVNSKVRFRVNMDSSNKVMDRDRDSKDKVSTVPSNLKRRMANIN